MESTVKIHHSWEAVLRKEFESDYFNALTRCIKEDILSGVRIYPSGGDIFSAFNFTPFGEVRVVILGQDPYHGEGQAHGLCFSVPDGVSLPPSLVNIFQEIGTDLGIKETHSSGNLTNWARQGVLLLNAILTVRSGNPLSHATIGWERFTDAVIESISHHKSDVVFVLWGKSAQQKGSIIDTSKHFVLKAPHPSPLSAHRGFLGCRHFSKANTYLESKGRTPIRWHS